ncbi:MULTISPECIES: SGNH/GDSL hydrolase family protein [unclassified Methylobacterium]|uniref:SGNH/GDSL hydrolase family protein n=1 Tax=unclassified Methylobacterium TaxID=2615210 RepID=UPI0006F77316|nr:MULTISPECIES: SGNH/GDSL hydrolase family protein [unclassified Methylobacterium]KQO53686.1 GDSL family lipase [Methylobacterium sp. Leaf86]KQO99218.1 GDSL family lipase [Methylobacterium sp. Leaf91]MBO1022143.1 SGNH/GDSL hydrolase family protein [Methylobacterium sp. SD274]
MLTLLKPCAAPFLGLALVALGLGAPAWAEPVVSKPAIPARALAKLSHVAALVKAGSDIRIVAFGSSSTEGSGASSPATAYPAQLQEDLQGRLDVAGAKHPIVTVLNRGKGGDDAEAMARRLDRDVLAERPDLVIWQTGSNDPMTGVTVERFTELTRQGITAMRAAGSDVILMDQQWCRRLTTTNGAERYGDALHSLAAELDVPVIRRHALMRTWAASGLLSPAQMIGPDGLHMTDAGYDRLAKAATAQILVNAGLIPADPMRN